MTKILLFIVALNTFAILPAKAQSQTIYNNEVKQASVTFINTLNPLQKKAALLSFDDTARIKWNNLPVGLRARAGISVGNMTDEQRKLFHRILSVALSSQGYLKATGIMHLDNLLNIHYDSLYQQKEINDTVHHFLQSLQWSHRNFYLAFFGNPIDATWGFKVEGHHLSINFTFVDNKLSVTPFFIGTDPAEYSMGEYAGWRVLGQEEDLGIKLIQSLSKKQQQTAIISNEVPEDIFTGAESGKRLLPYQGITAADMTRDQKSILQYIIREFVFNMEYEKAVVEYDKIIKAGIDKIFFGWIGPLEESKAHYYVLNGPTFLIEFDNHGRRGTGIHIHAIWREKVNEFGEDVLKEHYLKNKH